MVQAALLPGRRFYGDARDLLAGGDIAETKTGCKPGWII
jgi:hypothetical protein